MARPCRSTVGVWRIVRPLYSTSEVAQTPRALQPHRHNGAVERSAALQGPPTQDLVLCRLDEGEPEVASVCRTAWAKDLKIGTRLINARAEKVYEKAAFGVAFRSRRCLVPANGWFEWQHTGRGKQPYFLGLGDGSPMSSSPASGNAGTRAVRPSSPSPSSRPKPRRPLPAFITANLPSSVVMSLRRGSIPHHRGTFSSISSESPMWTLTRRAPSAPG